MRSCSRVWGIYDPLLMMKKSIDIVFLSCLCHSFLVSLRIITTVLEDLSVLKALKTAPEISSHGKSLLSSYYKYTPLNLHIAEQRRKRQRLSPATAASSRSTPYATPPLPPHPSSRLNPSTQPSKLKSKKDNIAAQLPLPPGRRVAFRQPKAKSPEVGIGAVGGGKIGGGRGRGVETPEPEVDEEGDTWIIAEVIRQSKKDRTVYAFTPPLSPPLTCFGQVCGQRRRARRRNRTTVRPLSPHYSTLMGTEGTNRQYTTTIKSLIPLPDPSAPPNTPSHPSSYGPYAPNSIVLGLYPETTAFYRATVVSVPRAVSDTCLISC